MKKYLFLPLALFLLIFGSLVLGSLAVAPSAEAFLGGVFKGAIEGRESARRSNYQDQMSAVRIRRLEINNLIQAYNLTGNYDYLCQAWAMGSKSAGQALFDGDMRCVSEVVTVVR
jgi:hypothetical protein